MLVARVRSLHYRGVPVLIPFTLIEALWFMPTQVSWATLGYIVAAAVFPGFGAYLAYSFMQRELGAARVGLVLYLGPIYGLLDDFNKT